ncbi:hypothetical protein GGTG_09600 [Gaeumannomyces tritici R3-111a-1]|uniref:Secreted protein n=1 Tax=Gaeumannomyces tritici (strain R3-111a-1) TaxID=644352 RepID=J3P7W0_GAET3|nr:hypothetical protein GGTG_09600 [Gaeumannomyces tritici R3-111a-1]EJT72743.1 hypothetical protein GGTG_09600 [Gaeumannomyces tritici R3-111a-1]
MHRTMLAVCACICPRQAAGVAVGRRPPEEPNPGSRHVGRLDGQFRSGGGAQGRVFLAQNNLFKSLKCSVSEYKSKSFECDPYYFSSKFIHCVLQGPIPAADGLSSEI